MKIEEGKIQFATGRVESVEVGLISIDESGQLFEGYDSSFLDYSPVLTQSEKTELADFMIDRWNRYKKENA